MKIYILININIFLNDKKLYGIISKKIIIISEKTIIFNIFFDIYCVLSPVHNQCIIYSYIYSYIYIYIYSFHYILYIYS